MYCGTVKLYGFSLTPCILLGHTCSSTRITWSAIRQLLNRQRMSPLPTFADSLAAAEAFSDFLDQMIVKIRNNLKSSSFRLDDACDCQFANFYPVSYTEASRILMSMKPKICILYPVPTYSLQPHSHQVTVTKLPSVVRQLHRLSQR